MSKQQITKALLEKGLTLDEEESNFYRSIPVPEGYVWGWVIFLTEESDRILYSKGYSYDYHDFDFRNTKDVLKWVEELPNCKEK